MSRKYDEAMEHANKTNDPSLQECLDSLKRWEINSKGENKIMLYSDFAPLSFYFELMNEHNQRILNGGVLYHGNPDQSYAVMLVHKIGWSIHT